MNKVRYEIHLFLKLDNLFADGLKSNRQGHLEIPTYLDME